MRKGVLHRLRIFAEGWGTKMSHLAEFFSFRVLLCCLCSFPVRSCLSMSKRILVIEDEPAIRTYLQKVLQRAGYDTVAASNGEEGLQLVRALLPDLVLCDVVMPKLNGYAVLEAVRWDQATAHIPFVFLSSKTSREATEQGRQLGSNAYLTKPIDQSQLLRAIAAHLTSRGCP